MVRQLHFYNGGRCALCMLAATRYDPQLTEWGPTSRIYFPERGFDIEIDFTPWRTACVLKEGVYICCLRPRSRRFMRILLDGFLCKRGQCGVLMLLYFWLRVSFSVIRESIGGSFAIGRVQHRSRGGCRRGRVLLTA